MPNFEKIISFMNQQLGALKELDELIKFNEEKNSGHSIDQGDIEVLKAHVEAMNSAVNTALALARYYKNEGAPKPVLPVKAEEEKKSGAKKTSRKKKTDPPKEDPTVEPPAAEEAADDLSFLD